MVGLGKLFGDLLAVKWWKEIGTLIEMGEKILPLCPGVIEARTGQLSLSWDSLLGLKSESKEMCPL